MQSDLDDENSSPTESEAELVATFPPVVEIHQQPSQPIDNESDIHNENIPFECMLPEKLFQNEDSNDSCDKKNTSPNDGNVQLFNDSPSNEQAIEQDQKNQLSREQQPDNEEHEVSIRIFIYIIVCRNERIEYLSNCYLTFFSRRKFRKIMNQILMRHCHQKIMSVYLVLTI